MPTPDSLQATLSRNLCPERRFEAFLAKAIKFVCELGGEHSSWFGNGVDGAKMIFHYLNIY